MKVNVMQYLSPAKRDEFYRNAKRPVARPASQKKTYPKLTTFADELKSVLR